MWSWNLNVELETNVELNVKLESGANLTLVAFFPPAEFGRAHEIG